MLPLIEDAIAAKGFYQEWLNPVCRKYNLTESEMLVLVYLSGNSKKDTASDIVDKQKLKKSIVSVSLKDLQNRGYITSTHYEQDHRSIHLELTEKGEEIVKEIRKNERACEKVLMEGFDREEKKALMRYLDRIDRNMRSYGKK